MAEPARYDLLEPGALRPFGLAEAASVPDVATLPPNAVVLSMSGTDRTKLRAGFVLWTLGVLAAGVAIGYYAGRRAR